MVWWERDVKHPALLWPQALKELQWQILATVSHSRSEKLFCAHPLSYLETLQTFAGNCHPLSCLSLNLPVAHSQGVYSTRILSTSSCLFGQVWNHYIHLLQLKVFFFPLSFFFFFFLNFSFSSHGDDRSYWSWANNPWQVMYSICLVSTSFRTVLKVLLQTLISAIRRRRSGRLRGTQDIFLDQFWLGMHCHHCYFLAVCILRSADHNQMLGLNVQNLAFQKYALIFV